MKKILVTGSRSFNRSDLVWKYFLKQKEPFMIIHGGAKGADSIATAYAIQNRIEQKVIRPIYPSKKEYYLHRNAEMIGMCDKVVAFWDGKSRGTQFTIRYAKKRYKDVDVIKDD